MKLLEILNKLNQLPIKRVTQYTQKKSDVLKSYPKNTDNFVGFSNSKMPDISEEYKYLGKNKYCNSFELLDEESMDKLLNFFKQEQKTSVGNKTIKTMYGVRDDGILRNTFYDFNFANNLYFKLINGVDRFILVDGQIYVFLNVNPLIRFINYVSAGHCLIPHYDVPVVINEFVASKKTLVLYISSSNSGATNFLFDHRVNHNYQDAIKEDNFEVLFSQKPSKKLSIIFDHYIFHESEKIDNSEQKLIITTELFYKKLDRNEINHLLN